MRQHLERKSLETPWSHPRPASFGRAVALEEKTTGTCYRGTKSNRRGGTRVVARGPGSSIASVSRGPRGGERTRTSRGQPWVLDDRTAS